ncbi:MAG: hypothetical protein IPG04_17900 [Polyangiaceae bacterium]|nr:hypothetical protein [Polyangiaceae bacterium]
MPSFVRAEVAPALAPESSVVGGTDAEARTVAYTFALDEDAGADEAAERIVALSLPGLEGSEGLERLFREALSTEVLLCEDDELDGQLQAWRDWKRDVYVLVEGLPPHDFARRLSSVYERVRVVVWGRPTLAIGAQASGEPFLERCVPEHLEPPFQRAFAFLKSKRR